MKKLSIKVASSFATARAKAALCRQASIHQHEKMIVARKEVFPLPMTPKTAIPVNRSPSVRQSPA